MSTYEEQLAAAEFEWLNSFKAGPQRTRWTEMPPQIGDPATDFERKNSAGENVRFSDFWKDKPALILFWRHFGCGCGVDRSKRLLDEMPEYEKAGVNVVIVGQGEPERSAYYARKYGIEEFTILSDPKFESYFSYGLLEGKESQILFDAPEDLVDRQIKSAMDFASERKADNRPLVDNPWLLPGEFVVDTAGILRLAYRYNFCEDFPDHRVHLTAIRETHLANK
jgi:peroxiredoxin